MNGGRRAGLGVLIAVAGAMALPGGATARLATQTLVFDSLAKNRFVDQPPTGPSRGDTELASASLRDASGHIVGSAHDRCVFTKVLAHDVLERCSGRAKTSEGVVSLAGVGHLESMNPPWTVTGRSGAYAGLRGEQVFATDIPLDPNVPLAAGRLFSVAVITVNTTRPLHVGVVPRPASNGTFIRRASTACRAAQRKGTRLPGFPFSNFDPFHPDPNLLPKVGQFFDQPARRRLPRALLGDLEKLGPPPASDAAWRDVLTARRALITNQTAQIKAALADRPSAFVPLVYQRARDYNKLVFTSAVFGVQSCTFS